MEPQARFEFTLHGANVHRVSRPPPLWETTILVVPYQGGDLTSLSYWGFRNEIPMCEGDKVFAVYIVALGLRSRFFLAILDSYFVKAKE